MSTTLSSVDCTTTPKVITLTWNAVVDKDIFSDEDVTAIKDAVEDFWNKRVPKFKYYECEIKLVANVVLGQLAKSKGAATGPKDTKKYEGYDVVSSKPTIKPGEGLTLPGNEPADRPHRIFIKRPFTDIGHEVGHALGLIDGPLPGQKHWDDMHGQEAAHMKKILWGPRGWDLEAACCGGAYHMDHEVAVTVVTTPLQGTPLSHDVVVTATSMDHKIARIEIWNQTGKSVKNQKSPANTEDGTIKSPTGVAKGQNSYSASTDKITIVDTDFPICIDVYEEAEQSPGEPGDGHRHGWFDSAGQPTSAKGHPFEKDRVNLEER